MNKTINRPKAGIIYIINSPGGKGELDTIIVTEELFMRAKEIISKGPFNPVQLSQDIMTLMWKGDNRTEGVIHSEAVMSFDTYPAEYLNKYDFIGMIPIETY